MSHVVVTGIKLGSTPQGPPSELPQRLEWQDFKQSPEYLTLYILALQKFMGMTQGQVTSYFQIAGIHGLPFAAWNGVQGVNPNTGYCNHGMNTFPSWHRPYVALYEQLLAGFFPEIVSDYTAANRDVGQRLQIASQTWRFPYWDWALNPTIPDEWISDTIGILGKDGTMTDLDPNPLQGYSFHPIDPSFNRYIYRIWQTTLRQPSSLSSGAVSRPNVANQQLAATDFKALILDLFPDQLFEPDPWGQFSNHTWSRIHPGMPTLTSIEGIHDTIHTDVGGRGHMGDPAVAAFDPIFWLHHCNVDRLLALWQTAYPDVYVSPGPDMFGTFVHNPDTNPTKTDINVNTPLEPFWKTQSDFATSADCRSTAAYGYTYPEIAQVEKSPSQIPIDQQMWNLVHDLYSEGNIMSAGFRVPQAEAPRSVLSSLFQGFERLSVTPAPQPTPIIKNHTINIPARAAFALPKATPGQVPLKAGNPAPSGSHPPTSNPHPPASNPHPPAGTVTAPPPGGDYVITPDTYQEWTVNATLEKYSLGGSGQVCFFLGPESEIPAKPDDWFTSPILVGKFGIFATDPELTGCANCKDQADAKTRVGGTVHLTKALIRNRIPLVGDEPVEYLKKNLHWRASTVQGVEVPLADIPSLKVIVQSAGYQLPPGGGIGARPHKLPARTHSPITRGRRGGVDHSDDFFG